MKRVILILAALAATCGPTAVIVVGQPVHADPVSLAPLQVEMSLMSAKKLAPGEPVLVHCKLVNVSPSEAATLSTGGSSTGWYSMKVLDPAGHPVQVMPRLPPPAKRLEGLYQTPERVLLPGEKFERDIVVNSFTLFQASGQYDLHVAVSLNYTMKPISSEGSAEDGVSQLKLVKDFEFVTIITPSNPPAVRARAEALRRELNKGGSEDSKTVAEELFSMPEGVALPTWQALAADPTSSDFVLTDAAEQMSFRPSKATADLVAQMLWETGRDSETHSPANTARLWVAMSRIYDTAPPGLKQYVRALYIGHGILASELDSPHVKSHPN